MWRGQRWAVASTRLGDEAALDGIEYLDRARGVVFLRLVRVLLLVL